MKLAPVRFRIQGQGPGGQRFGSVVEGLVFAIGGSRGLGSKG